MTSSSKPFVCAAFVACFCLFSPSPLPAQNPFVARDADLKALPTVPDGFEVELWAGEPMVSNPAALAFDSRGRLFIGMGPQWRAPKPDSPKDQIVLLEDLDGDGKADSRKVFAEGFNSVQSIAWHGHDLWVANSPDLTLVRDTNGDDVADEYIKIFTDLGNIEHSVHGLNWGPDGCLYLSKGNSKGISLDGNTPKEPGRIAPKAFLELWGYPGPQGAPDLPPPSPVFSADAYRATYQDPRDDWGQTGGILRYDPETPSLSIVSRGCRNPWDIAYDTGFNWLGTDNDQAGGDRVFMPFQHAHFGWGHTWSPDWPGGGHPSIAPNSGPIIEGSYTGIVFSDTPHFPESHRGVWFIGDWLRKTVYLYRPTWDGALNVPLQGRYEPFVTGGKSLFRPTDLAMGPDGALWVLGWGVEYGSVFRNGQQVNEGRVYRVTTTDRKTITTKLPTTPIAKQSLDQLVKGLASWIPARQSEARLELIRRGVSAIPALKQALRNPANKAQETWCTWILAKMDSGTWNPSSENQRLQLARAGLPDIPTLLKDSDPRIRLAGVEASEAVHEQDLVQLLARETDRVVYHAAWRALLDFGSSDLTGKLCSDSRPSVRMAGWLIRMEGLKVTDEQIQQLSQDREPQLRELAKLWMEKTQDLPRKPAQTVTPAPSLPDAYPFIQNLKARTGRSYVPGTLRKGETYYTDRPYQIRDFPPDLSGALMIRTANADDGSAGEDFLSFDALLDVTVLVAHDERALQKPSWLKGFQKTSQIVVTDDASYRLFSRDAPAGTIRLGGNTQNSRPGGKGQYFVVLTPRSPSPPEKAASLEEVLALLPDARPERGAALFFATGGAGCAQCHTVGPRGNAFGPDLTGAGDRFGPQHLIASMLRPNEVITEGFHAHSIETLAGLNYTGVLREQSSLAVTLALPGGMEVRIPRKDVEQENRLTTSPMPAFGETLPTTDLADITAFLLRQKALPSKGFSYIQNDNQLDVFLDGQAIGTYQFRNHEVLRPTWIQVTTPGGHQVTRHYPPRVPEDLDPGYKAEQGIIHPHMHTGIWLGFGHIDGHDYWRNTALTEHLEFAEEISASQDALSFAVLNRLLPTNGKGETCRQRVRYELRRHPRGWSMEIQAELFNKDRDFYLGDQEESGLGVRIASPLRVLGGNGRILNSHGQTNGAQTWGKEASWWDYSGQINGQACGILVKPLPGNARPCWGHTRDYGVMVINPFPRQPKERREPYVKTWVKKGEVYHLGYSVLIHEGPFNPLKDPF